MDGISDAELQLAAALRGIPSEQALIQQRMRRAQGLMDSPMPQGQMAGRVYRASSPLETLAAALNRYQGATAMKTAEGQYQDLTARANQAAQAQARIDMAEKERDWRFRQDEFGLKQDAERRQAEAAAAAAKNAAAAQAEAARHNAAGEAQARAAMEQDAWAFGQDANGGGFMYNRKTGVVLPLAPNAGPGSATAGLSGGRPNLPGKPTDKQKAAVAEANQSISEIDLALSSLDRNPGAYGGAGNWFAAAADQIGGVPAQSVTSRRFTPGEVQARNFVSNVVSQIINQRAGANVTLREELRQKFLPSDFDSLDAVKQKLKDLKALEAVKYEVQSNGALRAPADAVPTAPARPPEDVKAARVKRVSDLKAQGKSAQEILSTLKAEGLAQ